MSLDELLQEIEDADGHQNMSQLLLIKKCIEDNGNAEKHSLKLVTLLISATKSKEEDSEDDITLEALLILGECLNLDVFCQSLNRDQCVEVLNVLCDLMSHSTNKTTVLRSIWCCSMQKFDSAILANHCEAILKSLNSAATTHGSSAVMDCEILTVLEYLSCVAPNEMCEHCSLWWNHVVPKVVHTVVKVRVLATKVFRISYKYLQRNSTVMKNVVAELKSNVIKGMNEKYNQIGDSLILEVWTIIVKLIGKILHCGTSLINSLLEVIEKAFKSRTEKIRNEAILAWRALIANFAINLEVISSVKRVKLLLQPLKSTFFKSEEGIKNKVMTWWQIVVSLNTNLHQHFETVVVPLIEYCFGITTDSTSRSAIQTKLDSTIDDTNRILLLDLGIQILVFLFKENDEREPNIILEPLKYSTFSSYTSFTTRSELIMKSLVIACQSVEDVKPRKRYLLYVWKTIVSFIRVATDEARTTALKLSSSLLRSIHQIFSDRTITDVSFSLDLLEIGATLPESILTSSAVNLSSSDVLHGTPCIYLLNFLLQGPILNDKNCKKLIPLFKKLVSFEIKTSVNTLALVQATIQCIESTMSIITDPCIALSLWQITANQLIDYIGWTHDVNQGDDIDHDFSCIYVTLILPIKHLIWKTIPLTVKRSIPKTWSSLYETFVKNVSVVKMVDDNVYCIELATKILDIIETKQIGDDQLDELLDFVREMTRMIQWRNINYTNFGDNSLCKKSTRNSRNSVNLNPLFELFTSLVKVFTAKMEQKDKFKHSHDHLVVPESIALKILNQILFIFDHLNNEAYVNMLIHWIPLISTFFLLSNVVGHVISTPKITAKVDEVWSKLSAGIASNHKGVYDTEFLESLSPLFEVTLDHRCQSIRSYSRKLWCSTFATTYENLIIPPSLAEVMDEVEPLMVVGTIEDTWSTDSFESRSTISTKSPTAKITIRNVSSVTMSKKRRSLDSLSANLSPKKRKILTLDKILKVVISPDSTPTISLPKSKANEMSVNLKNEIQPLPSIPEAEVDTDVAANVEVTHVEDSDDGTEIHQPEENDSPPELILSSSSFSHKNSSKRCKRQLRFHQTSDSLQETEEVLRNHLSDVIDAVASYVEIEETAMPMTEELLFDMGKASLNNKNQSPIKRASEEDTEDLDDFVVSVESHEESCAEIVNTDWNSTSESTHMTQCSVTDNNPSKGEAQEYVQDLVRGESENKNESKGRSSIKKSHKRKKSKHKRKGRQGQERTTEDSIRIKGKKSKKSKRDEDTFVFKTNKKKLKKLKRKKILSKKIVDEVDSDSTPSLDVSDSEETRDKSHDSITTTSSDSHSIDANCSTTSDIQHKGAETASSDDNTEELSSELVTNFETVCESQELSSPEASLPQSGSTSASVDDSSTSSSPTELSNTLQSPSKSRVSNLVSFCMALSSSELVSPRSGILKKRKLDATLSPLSPPSSKKHRRVSFADPPVQKEMLIDSTVVRRKRKSIDRQLLPKLNESSTEISSASTEISPGDYLSSVTAELNGVDPICPELIDCDIAVDTILHRITSSTWTRGLNKLLISKNIRTIGQLSSLTEMDIMKLPLKTPKMKIVTDALQHLMKSNEQPTHTTSSISPVSEPIRKQPPCTEVPSCDEEASSADEPLSPDGPPCKDGPLSAEGPSIAEPPPCPSLTKEATELIKCPTVDLTIDDSSPMDDVDGLFRTVDEFFDKFVKDDIGTLNHQQVATICQRFFGYVNTISRAWIDARTRPVNKLANDSN